MAKSQRCVSGESHSVSLAALLALTIFGATAAGAQPAVPERPVSRAGDRSVVLHWDPVNDPALKGYRISRAESREGPYVEPIPAAFRVNHFVDFDVENGRTYYYYIRSVDTSDRQSGSSDTVSAAPTVLTDEAFMELVQQTAFDFFWYEANPSNGLIRDRNTSSSRSSIASVGFGLSALTVGIDRGWISRDEGRERVLTTLEFFWSSPQGTQTDATGYRGFYYHFLDMETGKRAGTTELSTIDTALLLAGVLHVGQYFDQNHVDELRIRSLADSINNRVDWKWAQVRPPRISHGWRPETGTGFIPYDWGGYNEAMIVYILALGSPTHPVDAAAWQSWTSTYNWQRHYGFDFVVFPPLFGHQYTHVWVDFRNIQDAYMRGRGIDYFENSRRATLANRAYAIANPSGFKDYGENVWGFTASDGPDGYRARGAPPEQNDDGTVTPTAPGGSFPFTPVESLAALRHMYDTYLTRIWSRYGFRDAFNPTRDWFATDHIGIDQGPIVLMIENYRTGAIWQSFMQVEAVQRGLERAGFQPFPNAIEGAPAARRITIESVYPNPAFGTVRVDFRLATPGHVRLVLYDVLGRLVAVPLDELRYTGPGSVAIDATSLPGGVYFYSLSTGREVVSGKMMIF